MIALAPFSLARAAPAVAAATRPPVLTTLDSAVLRLKAMLDGLLLTLAVQAWAGAEWPIGDGLLRRGAG